MYIIYLHTYAFLYSYMINLPKYPQECLHRVEKSSRRQLDSRPPQMAMTMRRMRTSIIDLELVPHTMLDVERLH